MIVFGSASFLVFGVVLVLVGANQADLSRALNLDLASTGLLGATLALGIGVGVAGSGPLVDRLPRRSLFAGAALLAAGALLLVDASMSYPRALLQMLLLGIGIGVHETVLNAAVSEIHGARAARPLLVVHAAVTVGAMLAPLGVGWLSEGADWTASFRATGMAQLALAAAALWVRFPAPRRSGGAAHVPLRSVMSPELLPFLIVGFSYVGVESALILFAVPYAEGLSLPAETGRVAISALWLGLLAGRLGLLAVPREIDARMLMAAGLLGGLVLGSGIGARIQDVAIVYAGAGFSMGLVFPVMIALTAQRFPDARGTATGLVAGAAALGGFVVPWLHGALGDWGGVDVALLALVPWCAAVTAAALAAWRSAAR